MKKLKLIVSLLFFVAVLGYALAFAASNGAPLALDFLIGAPVSLPVALWLGLLLLAGTVLGLLAGVVSSARHKLRIRHLNKEIADLKTRLNKIP